MRQIAVGLVLDGEGRILISQRSDERHLGGLWEFPGGRIQAGEHPEAGLRRELLEETGLNCHRIEPLLRFNHRYPATATHCPRQLQLHCFLVTGHSGKAESRLEQSLTWAPITALSGYPMPAANHHILTALQLPRTLPISPHCSDQNTLLQQLATLFASGCPLYYLRQPELRQTTFRQLAKKVIELGRRFNTGVILRAVPALAMELGAAGVQLSNNQLATLTKRPLPAELLLGASCHNREQLQQAARIGADYALLSPVQPTSSHPQAKPLGWAGFRKLLDEAELPVYALGGMQLNDLWQATETGAIGISGISDFTKPPGNRPANQG